MALVGALEGLFDFYFVLPAKPAGETGEAQPETQGRGRAGDEVRKSC